MRVPAFAQLIAICHLLGACALAGFGVLLYLIGSSCSGNDDRTIAIAIAMIVCAPVPFIIGLGLVGAKRWARLLALVELFGFTCACVVALISGADLAAVGIVSLAAFLYLLLSPEVRDVYA